MSTFWRIFSQSFLHESGKEEKKEENGRHDGVGICDLS